MTWVRNLTPFNYLILGHFLILTSFCVVCMQGAAALQRSNSDGGGGMAAGADQEARSVR